MLKIIVALTSLVTITQVFMVNMYAVSGQDISQLQQKIKELSIQNQLLANQIHEKSSLYYLSQKAQELNLSPQKISFESSPQPVASRVN